jgi:hypothetical protein
VQLATNPGHLTVDGAGVQNKATPTLAPGSPGDLTIPFRNAPMSSIAPSMVIKEMGMDVTVQVT